MRVVLDTNVLIAAFISQGVCHRLFEHCVQHHQLVTSDFILNELREKLAEKFRYDSQDVDQATELMRSVSETVTPAPMERPVCRDADDDTILATALAGRAACIVTGDDDLLVLREFQAIPLLRPRDFAEFEARIG